MPNDRYNDDVVCINCGNDEHFGLLGTYASTDELKCYECGEVFQVVVSKDAQ